MTKPYSLPKLPYDLDALEPWCSAETLKLHHGTHHQAYVDAANAAHEMLKNIDLGNSQQLAGAQSELIFNVGGHRLHSLFWENLSPSPTKPDGSLEKQIEVDFGDPDRLKSLLSASCKAVQGTGWGTLYFDTFSKCLRVGMVLDHQHGHTPGVETLAVIDVWEHAYYLGYQSDRSGWVAAVIDHLDWETIGDRLKNFVQK